MFRKDEDAIFHWSEAHVLACHEKQLQILEHAYQMLKEIGTIVYSTCTFSPEENEQTIEQFWKNILMSSYRQSINHQGRKWTSGMDGKKFANN